MNKAPLITAAKVTGTLQLVITWSTGETLNCNLATTVHRHAAFAPFVDPAIFSQVAVEEWGHGLDWPGGLDMGADRLYQLCREQAGLFSAADFDGWMQKNQLSLSSAAEALGMTRRMIAHYRSGSRPIPKTVRLACIGWETLKAA
ncbi:MAG: hypothetical protein A2075_19530 [Geobacteraceae bacterium GWC2_58_44]|nr:MAG: hypothetical protein A2075_19530 [Geobacteraceae bacterium GWC2_58_44]HBG04753.1 hypothetical protein [Geobacter sp.]